MSQENLQSRPIFSSNMIPERPNVRDLFSVLKNYHKLAVVVLAALVIRLGYCLMLQDSDLSPNSDAVHYLKAADTLVAGNGLHNDTHVRAYQPPGYFAFLAGIRKAFGRETYWIRIIQSIMGALLCVVIYAIATQIKSHRAGMIAAILCAVSPTLTHYSVIIYSEGLFIFLLCVAVLAVLPIWQSRQSFKLAATAGVLFGLATLTREVAGIIVVGIMVALFVKMRTRKCLLLGVTIVLVTFAVILPWTLRNYCIFRRLVPIATNAGINLYIGNHPGSNGEFEWVLPPGVKWNVPSPPGLPEGYNEYEVNRLATDSALAYIKDNPRAFLRVTARRAWLLLKPPVPNDNRYGIDVIIAQVRFIEHTGLIVFAICLLPLRLLKMQCVGTGLLVLCILVMLLPYVVSVVGIRYRVPTYAFLILLTALAIESLGLMKFDRARGLGSSDRI